MTQNELDSDTAFDGTTFTVPSGKGGTYFIYGAVTGDAGDIGQDGEQIRMYIYKNGSSQQLFIINYKKLLEAIRSYQNY